VLLLEIDQNGFFGTDADISANYGLIPITHISKFFKSCFLLHYQNITYSVLYLFEKNLKNQVI